MFPASECSTPSRKPSRFGGKDIKPQTLIDTHYRVPLHPSAEFQVNRNSLSDYDFYLVPASQNRSSSLTDRVSSHSNSHTGINYGDPKHYLPDGSISSTNYCQPSVCLPRPDHRQVIQALQQTHSCRVNATRRDRHPTHEFYNSFIGETDALRDLAPSDYNSDGTSVAGPEDQCIDDCSFLSDDEPPVAPFITGSELEHDCADNPSEKSSLISRTRTSRCAGRLPMTTTLGEDNLEASRHCQTIVEDDINKHNAAFTSMDAPHDPRRVKREPRNVFLASVRAAVEQPTRIYPAPLSNSSSSSSTSSSATSLDGSSVPRFTAHQDNHGDTEPSSFNPQIWATWNINTWKATPSSGGYTLSMPRPYLPLQFTASELRRVVEKQQKSLPQISSSVPRTNSSVNDISSWDDFRAEYQELCRQLTSSFTAQDKVASSF